jgi:NADPH:quinone reductase-like Zn-dependent oxidoreductase/SAM-dependent methyltransferase/acyl carrier protein
VKLDTADLGYLTDHRIGASIVFPAAGYIEMALATAREMFGNVPAVLEDIEFQKFLPLDEKTFCRAQVVLDPDLSEFNIYARPDASENSWDLHARGCVREGGRAAPARFDLGSTRARCPHALEKDECQRIFASMGLNYGPAFQGIVRLWRGGGEALAEIHTPDSVTGQLSDYRLHPAVLDACFQSALAVLSAEAVSSRSKGRAFVPVRIERIRFHSSPSDKFFAVARVKEFNAIGLTVDIDLVDEASNLHAEVRGLVCRQTEQRASGLHGALYEYQWQLKPLAAPRSPRVSDHLPPLDELVPILQHESDRLQKRFDRTRFQAEFHAMSRAAAAAYIVRALRTLGFTSQSFASTPIETLAGRLGLAPQYWKWLRLMSKELTAAELASTEDPGRLWKAAWDQFPECQVELMLDKLCGENLPAVLKGEIDPLGLIFPEGGMTAAEQLYQDSPTIRPNNLLAQKALIEIVRRLPEGKMLRILEIGGGTGGMTSFLLPALKEYNTEYVFTDVSPSFIANAQRRFAQYPFVQYRTLDIENDTVEQGFEPHSFDLIIAADVLHATRDLRKTIGRVKHLLASGGRLMLLEVTRPWLNMTLVFGLLRGWWLFEDEDVRTDEPSLSQERWKSLLREAGFDSISGFADGPDAETAQHSLMLARGPQQTSLSPAVARHPAEARVWLIFADGGTADRSSTGAQLALHLEALGDRVIQARFGTDFSRNGRSEFTIRDDKPNDMRRLLDAISRDTPRLAGILHFGSLDTETSEEMTSESLVGSARLGYIGVLHLLQALASTEGLAIDAIWLVTRSAQPIENRTAPLELAQSPLWGLGRVAIAEYQNLRCRLVDLATCSPQEIKALAEELDAGDDTEDEIALHGELRFVHRLLPVSLATLHGTGRQSAQSGEPFGIELRQPGAMDSLSPRPLVRRAPKPDEIEVEIAATGLNFKDLMTAMGMVPKDAITDDTGGRLLGLECAGRVVAVGDDVTEFAVADEVVVVAPRTLATHITIDRRFAAQKPRHLSLEQAATIPIAFVTAFYALHTLAGMRRGERVLIHSAAGGVGLAAVQLALQAGATVFATAGSPEKRQLLSALGATHVMDSRSLAFADEVLDITAGEGVDIVLNSLAGEAIDKSLSVLRPFGRFVEIGLIDIYKNRRIGMRALRKNISLFAVDLSRVFDQKSDLPQSLLREAVGRFGADGLKPLAHRVFPATRVADAFRTMAQAKHVGKLIVSVKDMEGIRLERVPRSATIDPKGSYLITGGLGGFGLAIAERLARGGAGHIVLASRSAASSSVQTAIASMRQPGVEITTCQMDVTKLEDVQRAIAIAQKVAPLRGILHAAMVLDDAPIERLTEQRMWQAMAPKIMGAWNLHSLTADMALDFFVMFSSFTSIVGNLGQANYVAGNAFLDMLAYYRRSRGLPALTVNWGNVGGAGYVARNKDAAERLERIGTTAMPIAETLDLLEDLMAGDAVQVGVAQLDWNEVGQLMGDRIPARLAGLRSEAGTQTDRSTSDARLREILAADGAVLPSLLEGYIRDHLARAIGASPARIDVHQSLLSLGLDSLIAVEVRNRINADLGMNVPLAKIIQSESINALASYIAERLLERRRGESSAPVFTGAAVDSTGEELGSLENEATLVAPIRGGVAHRQLEASETNHAAAE